MSIDPHVDTSMSQTISLPGNDAPTLVDAIEAVLGKAMFVDLTFPRCAFSFTSGRETSFAFAPSHDELHRDFLMSFRQHGGRHPVGVLPPTAMTGGVAGLCRGLQHGRAVVCVAESLDALKSLASSPVDEPFNFLMMIPIDAAHDVSAAQEVSPAQLGLSGFSLHCFVEEGRSSRAWLLYSSDPAARIGQQAPEGLTSQPVAAASKILPVQNSKQVIAARQLVHDGGYQAEGDENYSWLWTGPERCFRTIVPRPMDHFPRRLEVSIVRAETGQNLDDICVQLDGRVVPFWLDRWSENSGKIVVSVDKCVDYTVLGLIIPKLDTDKNSGRAIGLCVDKLILLPD